jgi:hypothetical protein
MTIPLPEESLSDPAAAERAVLRRIKRTSMAAWTVFFFWLLVRANWFGAVALTCSAALVMINFLWLEGSVSTALQPAPSVKAWRLVLPTVARFALFGLALTITLYLVRLNTISVLLGFSVVVIGILAEGVYSIWKALRDEND